MIAARRSLAIAAISFALLSPAVANAADPATAARADQLFKEGRTLLDQKKYEEACRKLAESYDLDPGAGTLIALAICHDAQGRTATAWDELHEAAAIGRKTNRPELANAASKRAAAMEPNLSKLAVKLPATDVPYALKLDGDPMTSDELAAPFPIDPGEHKIEVSAPQKAPRIYVVKVAGPGTTDVVVEELQQSPVRPAPVAAPVTSSPGERDDGPPADRETHAKTNEGGVQRGVGLGLVGLGVVGIGAGAVFGAKAASLNASSNGKATDDVKAETRVSLACVAGGTVALGAGLIVYFTAPRSAPTSGTSAPRARATARIMPDGGPGDLGLGLRGEF